MENNGRRLCLGCMNELDENGNWVSQLYQIRKSDLTKTLMS